MNDTAGMRHLPDGPDGLLGKIVGEFCPRFSPEGRLIYAGTTDGVPAQPNAEMFDQLGLVLDSTDKLPDAAVYDSGKGRLILFDAAASRGPITPKRRGELKRLFYPTPLYLIFVTVFTDRAALGAHLCDLAWGTEVWLAGEPNHLIHLNGNTLSPPR